MATLAYLCLSLMFVLLRTKGEQICHSISCGEIDIQFPFGLKGGNQGRRSRCSYPGFQLTCKNYNQTILKLSDSEDLVVKRINYEEQSIEVNDPNGCLPKRFLQNLTSAISSSSSSSSSSPFMIDRSVYGLYNITFLHCPSNITNLLYPLLPISCLSNPNRKRVSSSSSVIVPTLSMWRPAFPSALSECEEMSTAVVPIPITEPGLFWPDLNSDIELKWNKPNCGHCAARGQLCGFTPQTSSQIGCFTGTAHQSQGLSRSAKYGLTIGLGIPGLLCMIGLSCFIVGKFKMCTHSHRSTTELPNSISVFALQPAHFMMGLDGPAIEKFPKTLIGESGRLPKPNDNTCPICLCEYEPKEMLRTIPECNHYFHAHCIDEWLKMNATCPLCRNSPDASSFTISPSSSLSIHSSLSSSP